MPEQVLVVGEGKSCSHCHETKPFSHFEFNPKTYRFGRRCSTCRGTKSRMWEGPLPEASLAPNANYQRKHRDQRKYGTQARMFGYHTGVEVSIGDLMEMRKSCNMCCEICGTPEELLSKKLFIDHDHETGKIRGMLCVNCNSAIGMLREDEAIFLSAVEYLKKHNSLKRIEEVRADYIFQ